MLAREDHGVRSDAPIYGGNLMVQVRGALLSLGLMALSMSCGSDPAPAPMPGCVTGQTVAVPAPEASAARRPAVRITTSGSVPVPAPTAVRWIPRSPVTSAAVRTPPRPTLRRAISGWMRLGRPTHPLGCSDGGRPRGGHPPRRCGSGLSRRAYRRGRRHGDLRRRHGGGAPRRALHDGAPPDRADGRRCALGSHRLLARLCFEPSRTAFRRCRGACSIPFIGDAARATLFWSRPAGSTGYQRLGGLAAGATLTGSVTHFSSGFVADGVDYTRPTAPAPSPACSGAHRLPLGRRHVLQRRGLRRQSLTDLAASDFVVNEDGTRLSSESSATLLTRVGPRSSSPGARPQFLDQRLPPAAHRGRRESVTTLQTVPAAASADRPPGLRREASLTEWQAPTLDTARLLCAPRAPPPTAPRTRVSTNLYGAVAALSRQATAQATFRSRNVGGAFTSGYVVLFTDGGDTSGLSTQAQAVGGRAGEPLTACWLWAWRAATPCPRC